MNQRIIYKTPDGGVAVIVPATTIDACMKDIPKPVTVYDVPTGVFETDEDGDRFEVMGARTHTFEYAIVDVAEIPTDRTFRDAWEFSA